MNLKSTRNLFNYSDRKDLVAVLNSDLSISYSELFYQANQIAYSLSNKGIKKNNYIPLLIDDNLLFIKTVIALWNIGAVPVPLNTKLVDVEIFSLLDEYNFKFLITDKLIEFNFRVDDLETIDLSILEIKVFEASVFSYTDLENEAVVIFTSGSTGRPKGVVHKFSSLISNIKNSNEILDHKENDRWLTSLPFYHIGGFQIFCRSLFYGCTILIPESLQTEDLAKSISIFNPTHLSLVSTQLERLIHHKVNPNESLRVVLIGGGIVDDELMIEADKLGWKPYRVYGSSETAAMITAITASEIVTKPQSVGKPFNDVKIKISFDSEILIQSNSLFKKYLEDEDEASSNLVEGFYRTGDLGFLDNDGYLFIEARRTDLIVTGGENVNPLEVEKAIQHIVGIRDVCVFAKQDKTWGQIVACAIVFTDSSIEEKAIKVILKQKLAGYKIPKKFFFVDGLPRTSLGKLEREKIRKMF